MTKNETLELLHKATAAVKDLAEDADVIAVRIAEDGDINNAEIHVWKPVDHVFLTVPFNSRWDESRYYPSENCKVFWLTIKEGAK